MAVILVMVGCILFIVNLFGVCAALDDVLSFDELLNPITLYKENHVNVFGAIFLMIIWNICFIYVAPFFWIYKLCTVGRKE